MELAAQAVAEPQHSPISAAQLAEAAPGQDGLVLIVKPRHVAPGPHPPTKPGQRLQQAPVAELGRGGQVAAANEFEGAPLERRRFQLPDVTPLAPARHGQRASRCRAALA